jgi:hypothetical protein
LISHSLFSDHHQLEPFHSLISHSLFSDHHQLEPFQMSLRSLYVLLFMILEVSLLIHTLTLENVSKNNIKLEQEAFN